MKAEHIKGKRLFCYVTCMILGACFSLTVQPLKAMSLDYMALTALDGLCTYGSSGQTAVLQPMPYCDNAVMMTVTLGDTSTQVIDTVVCNRLYFHGETYTVSGFYEQQVLNNDGYYYTCQINLTIHYSDTTLLDTSVCQTAFPLLWHGVTFSEPATKPLVLMNDNQCDSVLMLTVHLFDSHEMSVPVQDLLAGGSDTIPITIVNGHASDFLFTVSGTWCSLWHDSLLIVAPPADLSDDAIIDYSVSMTDTNGCVMGTAGTFNVYAHSHSDVYENIQSEDLPYTWNGIVFTSPGVHTAHFQTIHGADSTITLHLSVVYNYDTTFCNPAMPLLWHDFTFQGSGTLMSTIPMGPGADSVVVASVQVEFVEDTIQWFTVMEDDLPLMLHGHSIDTSGTYAYHFFSALGCEHTLTLHVTVLYNVQTVVDSLVCPETMPFVWNGKTFTGAGTQTAHFMAANGADSTVVMTVTLRPSPQAVINGPQLFCSETPVTLTADSADSYAWSTGAHTQSVTVSEVGTYYLTVTNQYGCSDNTSHEVAVMDIDSVVDISSIELCAGNSSVLSVGYHDTATVQISHGVSTLAVAETIFLPDGVPCSPYGCSYRSPVLFTDFTPGSTIQSVNDILFVRLNIEHSYIGDLYINITCPNGQKAHILKYGGSGTSDCDNTIPANAMGWQGGNNMSQSTFFGIANDNENPFSWNACNSDASGNGPGVGWNYCWSDNTTAGYTYAPGAGSLVYRYPNAHNGRVDSSNVAAGPRFYHPDQSFASLIGCPLNGSWYIEVVDGWSIDNGYIFGWELALDPSLLPATSNEITAATVDGPWAQSTTGMSYQITPPDTLPHDTVVHYTVHLYDDYGCGYDTIVTLTVHASTMATIDTVLLQNNLPLIVNGQHYNTPGHYTQHLSNHNGCDSTLYIDVDVLYNVQTSVDTALCMASFPFTWNGKTFVNAGTQNALLVASNGVDSTVVMTVSVLPVTSSTIHAAVVENNLPYMLNGTPYTQSGAYTQHLTNAAGCDSTITLNLTVYPNVSVNFDTTVCADDLPLVWHDQTFTAADTKTNQLTTIHGADSVEVCHLSVDFLTATIGNATEIVCYGESTGGAVATVTGGQAPLSIQWTNGAGELVTSNLTLANQPAGNYSFTVADQVGCVVTRTVTLNTLNGPLEAGTISSDQDICDDGQLMPFEGTPASGGDAGHYEWQWSMNGADWSAAPGTNNGQNYTCPDDAVQTFALRRAWISQTCGTVYSNTVQTVIWNSYHDTIADVVCQNIPYENHGFFIPADEISEPGNYVFEQLLSTGHCDSLIVLQLTVTKEYTLHYEDEICEGTPYVKHGFAIAASETIGHDALDRTLNLHTDTGCDSVLELHLTIIDTSLRIISLTEDFCDFHTAELQAVTNMTDYVWNTGEQSSQITVTETGVYSVTATQSVCARTAEYRVEVCTLQLYLPNAITPGNGDGLNDYFSIPEESQRQMMDFEIAVYNRWGELVFFSADKSFRWNGEVRGKIYRDNVYHYVIKCTNWDGRPFLFRGSLTVL